MGKNQREDFELKSTTETENPVRVTYRDTSSDYGWPEEAYCSVSSEPMLDEEAAARERFRKAWVDIDGPAGAD